MELKFKKGDLVKITKLSASESSQFQEGFHPNGIEKGYINMGYISDDIEVGKSLFLSQGEGYAYNFLTSIVVNILSDSTFETMNSIYLLEPFVME